MRNINRLGLFVAIALIGRVALAGTVTYVYTDQRGTPIAEADATGNITQKFDYRPYGQQALGTPPDGVGFTGQINDPEADLVYMQARYYDPTMGRFLSVDPAALTAGNAFKFNRYDYASNNPVMNVDPDGKDCLRTGDWVTCTPMIDGQRLTQLPVITFPATANWPDKMDSSSEGHHAYIYSNPVGKKTEDSIRTSDVQDPTPNDNDRPATPQGTSNMAAPSSGFRGFLAGALESISPGSSQVTSYAVKDSNGATWTINVTQDTHTLASGYVLRGAVQGDAISYGEGTALKQNLGRASEVLMNDAFQAQNQKNIDEAK